MADDAPVILSLERARRAPTPPLHVVEQAPADRHFAPLPRARFHPADDGAVRLGVVRLGPDVVEELLNLFSREGAWPLFDDLSAAASGLTPEPPSQAA